MTLASLLGPEPGPSARTGLCDALARIASGARAREEPVTPSFPADAFALLRDAGALVWNAVPGEGRPPRPANSIWSGASPPADGSVGRIYRRAPERGRAARRQRRAADVRSRLGRPVASRLWAGVWGADPLPGEGPPAELVETRAGSVLRGVKTFCSGAGGLHRAIVLARPPGATGGPPQPVWMDLTDGDRVEVDETWFTAHGLRASTSHRVVFHDAPVLALVGRSGALAHSPGSAGTRCGRPPAGSAWRTGLSRRRSSSSPPARARASSTSWQPGGSRRSAQHSTVWIAAAAEEMDTADDSIGPFSVHCGWRSPTRGARSSTWPRARAARVRSPPGRRSTALAATWSCSLLQHRLDPLLARARRERAGSAPSVPRASRSSTQLYRARPRSVGLRDQRVRAGKYARDDRRAAAAGRSRARSSSEPRSACSPSGSRRGVARLAAIDGAPTAVAAAREPAARPPGT